MLGDLAETRGPVHEPAQAEARLAGEPCERLPLEERQPTTEAAAAGQEN